MNISYIVLYVIPILLSATAFHEGVRLVLAKEEIFSEIVLFTRKCKKTYPTNTYLCVDLEY